MNHHFTLFGRLTLLGVLMAPAGALASAPPPSNLLVNPSFENGLTGWSPVSGTTTTITYGNAGGPGVAVGQYIGGEGSYLRDNSGGAVLEQVVSVGVIPAGTNVRASGYFGGGDTDDSRLIVRYLNAGGGEISRDELDYITRQDRNLETVLMFRER